MLGFEPVFPGGIPQGFGVGKMELGTMAGKASAAAVGVIKRRRLMPLGLVFLRVFRHHK